MRAKHHLGFALGVLTLFACVAPAPKPTAEAPSADWLARAQRGLAEREYEASHNGTGLQAPNRAHGLRIYFGPGGIRVHDRTEPGSPELLALQLTGVGRGAALAPLADGEVASEGPRVEIRRAGLVEWYLNSPAGLEQGFTLAERPDGHGPLVLELSTEFARASLAGDHVVFSTPTGRRLAYDSLVVRDAEGTELSAHFEVAASDRVRIAVEDAGAVYPVVIDPLLTETADAVVESNQDFADFGRHVAGAGDVNGDGYADVIVGAGFYDDGDFDEGAAFVFHGGPGGVPSGGTPAAAAYISSDQALANLGTVAGAGDVNGDGYDDVIVGALAYDAGQGFREGAAFVFLGGPSGVGNGSPANADAQLESNQGDAWFGVSVAGAGDVNGDGYADVIVGAHRYDAGEGAAFVFHGSAAGIADGNPATADTSLDSTQAESQLGISVAGAGDVNGDGFADVLVGADLYDNPDADEGAAFVYLGGASGIADGGPGTASAVLESNQAGAFLGQSVASAGDVNGDGYADVIVGADAYDQGQSEEGGAFVFHGSASGIASGSLASAAGRMESNQGGAHLGFSVAGAGDVNGDGYADVIAGAYLYDGGDTDDGAAFVLLGSSSGIGNRDPTTAFAALDADADVFEGRLGISVAGAGDVNGDGYADVIAGAIGYDGGNTNEGAAFVYHGGAQGVADGNPATAAAQLVSNQDSSNFGYGLAGAGDVNGDGYADLIVGAFTYDSGEDDEGAAFIFHGSASGIASANPATAATVLQGDKVNTWFGSQVASAGDVNGDGYGDVIVSAIGYDSPSVTNEGAAFIFLGSASGIANGSLATAATILESNQVGDPVFGYSVAGAGDVNGDGYADVIVTANRYDNGETDEGAAFLFHGSASGIASGNPSTAAAIIESNVSSSAQGLGDSASSAGDVNGDGYADVIVGAQYWDDAETDEGAAFVFYGGPSGIGNRTPATADATITSNQADGAMGSSVAAAGDVNGDGYGDVIVGASGYDAGQGAGEGAGFVFLGSATGIASGNPATAAAQLESDQPDARLGSSVASVGDVNGDGYADVIVGAYGYDVGVQGAAFVFLGSAAGIADGTPATAATRLESNQAAMSVWFGRRVVGAGDVNGDGYADVAIGSAGNTYEGGAFVFLGNGDGDGRRVLARQLSGGTSNALVQPWALAGSANGTEFRVRVQATHPEGRGRVNLQVQACASGVAFGNPSCTTQTGTSWTDVTASGAGVTLTKTVSGLAPNTLYRWRARVLHAPFSITQPGITASANPSHGPWRRLSGQAFEGDLRLILDTDEDGIPNTLDPDDDNDGLSDIAEGVAGTNPLDADSDDDGLSDGTEVLALFTNPLDPDHDNDGYCDGSGTGGGACTASDNCPAVANGGQTNSDALAAGDACQCGDVTGEGVVNATDVLRARENLVQRTLTGPFDLARCDVAPGSPCDPADIAVLERYLAAAPVTVANACDAYLGP